MKSAPIVTHVGRLIAFVRGLLSIMNKLFRNDVPGISVSSAYIVRLNQYKPYHKGGLNHWVGVDEVVNIALPAVNEHLALTLGLHVLADCRA